MVDSIRQRRQFDLLRTTGHRGRSGPVWVTFAPSSCEPAAAFAVSTAVGNAVVRNRVRRRLRVQFRDASPAPDGLYLVGVRPEAVEKTSAELGKHLGEALERATNNTRAST